MKQMTFGHERLDVYRAAIKQLLDRIVAMQTKLGQRGYSMREAQNGYGRAENESDSDPDSDPDNERIAG
jgi:hypothetical protein